jgi:PhoPQ-activated pathogenicity-related protein
MVQRCGPNSVQCTPIGLREQYQCIGEPLALLRVAVFLLVFVSAPAFGQVEQTALDRYVATPDPNYRYDLITTFAGNGYTGYVIEMTSQQWRNAAEVDHPLWKHWLTIVRPDRLATNTALMIVSGGSNESRAPSQVNPLVAEVAVNTHSVVAEVRMVPNQPLVFADDPGNGRKRRLLPISRGPASCSAPARRNSKHCLP